MQPWIRDCLLNRDERMKVHQATTTVIAIAAMTVLLFCAYAWSISGSRGGSFEYLVLAAALTMLGCLSASVLLGVLTYATLRYLVSTPQPQAIKLLAAGLGAILLSTILFFGFAAPGTLVAEGVRHQAPGLVALFGTTVSEPATFEFRDAHGQRYTLGSAPFYALTASLAAWVIEDKAHTRWKLDTLGTIVPGEAKTIRRNGQAMSLNNSGDTVRLKDAHGTVVQTVSYPKAVEGQAIAVPVE